MSHERITPDEEASCPRSLELGSRQTRFLGITSCRSRPDSTCHDLFRNKFPKTLGLYANAMLHTPHAEWRGDVFVVIWWWHLQCTGVCPWCRSNPVLPHCFCFPLGPPSAPEISHRTARATPCYEATGLSGRFAL